MRGFLERQLRSDGFDVLALSSTDQLPRAAAPDVLVLGDPDALERCRVPDCPVIVLGRGDFVAKVRALERCDDYLVRPFAYEELVARIRALLRRRPPHDEVLDLGELVVDRAARRVLVCGRDVVLSQKEYGLLVKLATDPDRVFTREQLLRDVWGYPVSTPTRTLESHASRHPPQAGSRRPGRLGRQRLGGRLQAASTAARAVTLAVPSGGWRRSTHVHPCASLRKGGNTACARGRGCAHRDRRRRALLRCDDADGATFRSTLRRARARGGGRARRARRAVRRHVGGSVSDHRCAVI